MSELTGGNSESGRFAPGESGNPAGRPKGARNKASILAAQLFEQKVEAVAEKIIERALGGSVAAMRLFLDRATPQLRDRIAFEMPELRTSDDAIDAQLALVTAVGAGEVSPREAERMMGLLETIMSTLSNRERNARIDKRNQERIAAADAAYAERAAAMEEARAAAAESAGRTEIFEETTPADPPCPAADTDTTRSGDDPVMAGPLAFLEHSDPDGIVAGIREAMPKADPHPRPPYPPYSRERTRRIGYRVPV